jgi:hypothetical protein
VNKRYWSWILVTTLVLFILPAAGAAGAQAQAPGVPAQQTPSPTPMASPSNTAAPTGTAVLPSVTPVATGSPTPTAPAGTAPASPVPERDERPFLVLTGSSADPGQPAAGTSFQLDLDVANQGDADAHNVQLALSSDAFVAIGSGSTLYQDKIPDGDDETMGTRLTVTDTATPGVHSITVDMRYEDRDGKVFTDRATVGVDVAASVQQPVIVVQAVRMPSRVAPGIPFTIALDLANTGSQPATNVVVAPAAGPLALQGGGGSAPVYIPAGGLATVSLRVAAASPEAPGAVSQTLDIRYNGPTGAAFATTHVVGVVITGGAGTDPLPMVTGYRAGDQLGLHPGQVFELVLDVTNVGVADAFRTMMALGGGTAPTAASGTAAATSGSSLGVFAPLDTSNMRYLGHLPAGGTTTVTQRLIVDGAAKPGPYVLEIAMTYVDAKGTTLSNTEVISLVVTRPVDLALTATSPVTTTVAGESLPYPVEVLNRGANTVNVKEVTVAGPDSVEITDGSRYVGPLDAGASDTLEPVLTPGKEGPLAIEITAHYLDDLNNDQVVTQTYTLTVTAAAPETAAPASGTPGEGNLFIRVLKGFLGLGASPPLAVTEPGRIEVPGGGQGQGQGSSGSQGTAPVRVRAAPANR